MYKLIGHSLEKGEWFEPESQPMTLTERNSTCSITLGPGAPEIGFGDWILDDGWPEGPIVWRVKSIDHQTDTKTVTVGLEHLIRILEDIKLFEDVTASDIRPGRTTIDSYEAIDWLLNRQNDWRLGTCLTGDGLPYEFSGGDSLLDAIESVSDTLNSAEWWYDFREYPFVLNIFPRNENVRSEMRNGRNLTTLRRNINRSGFYTRIYPVGKNDLHITGNYISRNESTYGRVDKVETHQGKTTEASLRAWADGLLKKHCEPLVTITISGLELSQETEESLDWIQLNRVCRCPLPEFNTTIVERVIKIAWRDRKKDPQNMTATLGNNQADVRDLTKAVEETSKRSGSGARGQAKQNYLFEANGEHLLYEVFDECGHLHGVLRMTEQSLRTAFENLNECTRSEFLMTSESLRVQFENEINSTRSEFQMTSESLRVQFQNEISSTRSEFQMTSESLRVQFQNEISSTRSEFQMTSESLRVTFENDINSTRLMIEASAQSLRSTITDTADGLQTQISQNARAINLKVGKGDVGTQLAVELGNVSITGGNLVVDGYVTAAGLASAIAAIENLSVHSIRGDGFIVTEGTINGGGDLQYKGTSVGTFLKTAIVDSNTLTLKDGNGDTVATFSKATTLSAVWDSGADSNKLRITAKQTNGGVETDVASQTVAISLAAGGWANGKNIVTASHGTHDIKSVELTLGDPSWSTPIWTTNKKAVTVTVTIRGRDFQTIIDTTEAVEAGAAQFTPHADITPISSSYIAVNSGSTSSITPIRSDANVSIGSATTITPIGSSSIRAGTVRIYNLRSSTSISVKKYGSAETTLYYKTSAGEYKSAGHVQWYMGGVSGSTTYYTSGGTATAFPSVDTGGTVYYTAGTPGTYYPAGSTTYYRAGTAVACYLYNANGTKYYLPGTKVTGLYTKTS